MINSFLNEYALMYKKNIYFWETRKFHSLKYFRRRIDFVINNCIKIQPPKKHNIFFEEVCPTIALAEKLGVKSIFLTNGNDPYDAKFIFPDGTKQIVECTCIKNGYYEAKQMEYLHIHHTVSLTALPETLNCRETKDLLLSPEELIKNAIRKKEEKAKKNIHYRGAILLLVLSSNFIYSNHIQKNLIKQLQSIEYQKGIFKDVYLISENPLKINEIFYKV